MLRTGHMRPFGPFDTHMILSALMLADSPFVLIFSCVQVVAVCDVNTESAGYWSNGVAGREPAKRLVEQKYTEPRYPTLVNYCEIGARAGRYV